VTGENADVIVSVPAAAATAGGMPPTVIVGATGPTGPTGSTVDAGVEGTTGPTGAGSAFAGRKLELQPRGPDSLDRGYEPQTVSYAMVESDPSSIFSPEGPPAAVYAGIEGLAFAVALAALVLAGRLRRQGIRLLMLVFIVGPIVAVVWL